MYLLIISMIIKEVGKRYKLLNVEDEVVTTVTAPTTVEAENVKTKKRWFGKKAKAAEVVAEVATSVESEAEDLLANIEEVTTQNDGE